MTSLRERAPLWMKLERVGALRYEATLPGIFILQGLGIAGIPNDALVSIYVGDRPFITPPVPARPLLAAYRVMNTEGTFPAVFARVALIREGERLVVNLSSEPEEVMAWGLLSREVKA